MKSIRKVLIAALTVSALTLVSCSDDVTSQTSPPDSPSVNPVSPEPSTPSSPPLAFQTSKATTLRSGSFVDGEHPTQGIARIIEQDNQRFLELDDSFATSTSGPDLVVILHRSGDVIGSTFPPAYPINEGDYVFLAPLERYTGAQTYLIPDDIPLADYQSAAIWCRKFNATFGAATLKS